MSNAEFWAVFNPNGEIADGSIRKSEDLAVSRVVIQENRIWPTLQAKGWELKKVKLSVVDVDEDDMGHHDDIPGVSR